MRADSVRCNGGQCVVEGEGTLHATVDYVFAYTPTVVRYTADGTLYARFDPPVECERRDDFEQGVSYLYCAPQLLPTRIEFYDGEPYLVEEGD